MKRLAVASAALLLALVPMANAFAVADTTPGENLGGYIGQASAMAVSFQPVFPALLPTSDAPFEATLSLTTANVRSGGNAFGRASSVWPGNAASDPGPLIGQGAGQPQVGELFPKWPVQAQANQDAGIVTAGVPPAIVMQATGFPDQAAGDARLADLLIPGLAHISHVASTSSSVVTDSDVTSIGEVSLQGASLFNGYITFDTLHSISKTTSNGSSATSTGDVTLTGLRIGGANVKVTDEGFQVEGFPGADQAPGGNGQPFPNSTPEQAVQQTLKSLNARITLFRSVGGSNAGAADRLTQGLVFSIDNPVGNQAPIPGGPTIPPGHFDFILGATSSSTVGSPPFTQGLGGQTPGETIGSLGSGGSTSIGGGPEVQGSSLNNLGDQLGTTPSSRTSSQATGVLGEAQRAGYHFGGVPLGLAIALLIVAAILARIIKRFFDSIMLAGGKKEIT